MKMSEIKQKVYSLTATKNTKELKKQRPQLVKNKDLRYKNKWIIMLKELKALHQKGLDISLNDLEKSEKMLKQSLVTVGKLAGLNDEKIEMDWQRIKLESQFINLHIEDL